jgi:hypothetical protein
MTADALDRLRAMLRDRIKRKLPPSITIGECSLLLDALDAREADAKDAQRYRWLRDDMDESDKLMMIARGTAHYDAAIDAALRGGSVESNTDASR